MDLMVYVAAPIDQQVPGTWTAVRDQIRPVLLHRQMSAFWPMYAFTVGLGVQPDERIEQINRAALQRSDAVLALVPKGVPTIGVPREIEAARAAGKPVAVLTDADTFSLQDLTRFPISTEGIKSAASWIEQQQRVPNSRLLIASDNPAWMPVRKYTGDAGLDLIVSKSMRVAAGSHVDVPCGIRIAVPDGHWVQITGRSSTMRRRGLLVTEGVIDGGYRGPIFTGVTNLSDEMVTIEQGERLAQMIVHRNYTAEVVVQEFDSQSFDELPHDGRGAAGFGSTGT